MFPPRGGERLRAAGVVQSLYTTQGGGQIT